MALCWDCGSPHGERLNTVGFEDLCEICEYQAVKSDVALSDLFSNGRHMSQSVLGLPQFCGMAAACGDVPKKLEPGDKRPEAWGECAHR